MATHKEFYVYQISHEMSLFQPCLLLVADEGTKSMWKKNKEHCVNPVAASTKRMHPHRKTRIHRNHISWPSELTQ